jgi:hypothetical protein
VGAATCALTRGSAGAAAPAWTDLRCVDGGDNAAAIERALDGGNVRIHGFCGVDWSPLERDRRYWKGVAVPDDRNLQIAADAVLYLRPGQAVIPADPDGSPSTEYADIIVNRAPRANRVAITGTGVIDGMAGDQRGGNGYDGIQLHHATDSTVWGPTIRNIRGVDSAGGPTESFALQFLDSVARNSVVDVKVSTSGAAHRAVSSSGIATNLGTDVTIIGSHVSGLQGRCFTSWWTNGVTRRNNVGDNCDAAAFGNEYGRGGRDEGNWYANSGHGIDLLAETAFRATGMVIAGNRGHAVRFNGGCRDIALAGEVFPHPRSVIGGVLTDCAPVDDLIRRG